MLVKIIHISVQNLYKQLDTRRRLHAAISDAECPLQTLQNSLAVTVELQKYRSALLFESPGGRHGCVTHIFLLLLVPGNRHRPP